MVSHSPEGRARTALITGSGGFVGPHLARELLAHGWRVVGVDHAERPADLPAEVDHRRLDLLDPEAVATLPRADAVVHLAGLSSVPESFREPQRYLAVNTGLVTTLGEELLRRGDPVRWLVVSTGALYDARAPQPLDEDAPLACASPYAVSKAATELQVDYYVRRGLDAVVVRPFNHIGPGQRPGFLLPDLVRGLLDAHATGEPMRVGDLTTARDYTDVRDVCRAYRLLLEAPALPTDRVRRVNVASGRPTTGRRLLELAAQAAGVPVPAVVVDPDRLRPTDAATIAGDASALHAATGWEPVVPLERTVADVVAPLLAGSRS